MADPVFKKCIRLFRKAEKKQENISSTLTFAAAGLTRPAPAEPPQGRNAARISGCSGAM